MQTAHLDGIDLEYEITGAGEPVLFISPVLADGFLPLLQHPTLVDHYQLIHYHRRGWVGSTHTPGPVSIHQHVADAAALLDHLGIPRIHAVGHSSGAAVAAQLALDHPENVHTLTLLELSLLSLPNGQAFLEGAGPVFQIYERGDHEQAFAAFMSAASGLDWDTCRTRLDRHAPGVVAQSVKDADTFFRIELPSLAEWSLDADQAAAIEQPVLSVLGSRTEPLWVEVAAFLRTNVPRVDEAKIEGVGHLLHIQDPDPVAKAIASFLRRHTITPTAATTRGGRPSTGASPG
jgi:pimeloyl-ACP methyl ester carboxylesterase